MRPELDETVAPPANSPNASSAQVALDTTALAPAATPHGAPVTPHGATVPLAPVTPHGATVPLAPSGPGAPADRTATAGPHARAGDSPGLVVGQQLGHFRIERPLGAGGMGEVYLATDLALDRPVAIKVLPAAVARDAASRERMVREARSQARITHPNVGHIYFIGEEVGRLYFAMEYVAGETLTARIASGPLEVDDALALIRAAALGLREAQRNGITHRDVKPSNLMVDGHGMVKVLDFGLAAGAFAGAPSVGALDDGPVAQTSMAGTPLYMAPEQARGEPVDFRCDIYALGATLFHLVAGRPPFEADDLGTLLSKHASANRPAIPRRTGQPRTTIAAVDALAARMMAPAPADRFASYDELIRAIEVASLEHQRPAGMWVRMMASLVDLILAAVVVLAVVSLCEFALRTNISSDLFQLAGYVLYGGALTARNGRTLGQWLFELEVVDVATGQRPSLRRAFLRVAVPTVPPLLVIAGKHWLPYSDPVFAIVVAAPFLGLIWASLRSVNKQTYWDRISHTLVRYRTRRTTAI